MKQPVRKKIEEVHADKLIDTTPIYTLLVDGTNLLKISMADPKVNTRGEHIGAIFQFLLQLKMLFNKKEWDYVYVFFDDEDSGILRYEIYHQYKANRDKHYAEHLDISDYAKEVNNKIKSMQSYFFDKKKKEENTINNKKKEEEDSKKKEERENFNRERTSLLKYFNEMSIRWMMDKETEGDDLISFYIQNKKEQEKIVIVSADEDITQLLAKDVCIYNPRKKKFITDANYKSIYGIPYNNVLIKKIFCGDTSDNISNISGLSEEKLYELIPEIKEREITIDEVKNKAKLLIEERIRTKKKPFKYCENIINGIPNKEYDGDFYEINEKIINLKKPLLTESAREELLDMMYAPQDPSDRSYGNLYQLIIEDDITELMDDNKFAGFFRDFKKLSEKEKKLYEKYIINNQD